MKDFITTCFALLGFACFFILQLTMVGVSLITAIWLGSMALKLIGKLF